jgi:regulator of protease activity HflC (stomatin/prohibitin superfamily)
MCVRSCPTYDNVFIEIDIAVVFKCKDDEESIKSFAYNISINQLNEQLEAALTERLRVLARGKTHLEVYLLRKDHTHDILDFLNKMFESKGLEFTRIIITNVKLPEEIAKPLDYKAQYGSMNEYEKTRHEFDIRLLNDDREIELIHQRKV